MLGAPAGAWRSGLRAQETLHRTASSTRRRFCHNEGGGCVCSARLKRIKPAVRTLIPACNWIAAAGGPRCSANHALPPARLAPGPQQERSVAFSRCRRWRGHEPVTGRSGGSHGGSRERLGALLGRRRSRSHSARGTRNSPW